MNWAVNRLEQLISERDSQESEDHEAQDSDEIIMNFGHHRHKDEASQHLDEEGSSTDEFAWIKADEWKSIMDLSDSGFWECTSSKNDHEPQCFLNKPIPRLVETRPQRARPAQARPPTSLPSSSHGRAGLDLQDAFTLARLQDSCTDFWQSDGALPHGICVRFVSAVSLSFLILWLDKKQDESYTPRELDIKALAAPTASWVEISSLEVEDPAGTARPHHLLLGTNKPPSLP